MLDRRCKLRRRVSLEGRLTADLRSAPISVRVRTISDAGAEIVVPDEALPSEVVSLTLSLGGVKAREAKVVWRRMGHFGLQFLNTVPVAGHGSALVRQWRIANLSS